MHSNRPLSLAVASCACLFAVSLAAANADTTQAPSPAAKPAPTAKPNNLTFSGVLRAYQFDRENVLPTKSQSATNFLAGIHSDYKFGTTGFGLGASYYGAYAFGTNGLNPQLKSNTGFIDNTLPGSTLSAFPETYLQYKSSRFTTTIGNQFINEKWAPASDTRVKPAAYQGIEAAYKIAPHLTVDVARIIRFEGRTSSAFTRNTLLTSSVLGASPLPDRSTAGFLLANLKYDTPEVSALLENYSFYDIANLQYGEARAKLFQSPHNPFIAVQYVGENQTGKAVVGAIHNHTYGAQLGVDIVKNLSATVAYDGSPSDPNGRAAVLGTSASPAYSNIASPYSNGYATDPLFTSSLTTGPVESPTGRSFKGGIYYTSDSKRLKIYATRAVFANVGFNPRNTQYETDGDVTYFLNPVTKGVYHGLSIRERYGVRNQPFVTANPSFQYVRTQVQYAF